MFWDKIAGLYDLFENIYNKSVYKQTGVAVAKYVSPQDSVLECACGTGAISIYNGSKGTNKVAVKFLHKLGANFKCQFDEESYREFFEKKGYKNVSYEIVKGRMSCEIAIIHA